MKRLFFVLSLSLITLCNYAGYFRYFNTSASGINGYDDTYDGYKSPREYDVSDDTYDFFIGVEVQANGPYSGAASASGFGRIYITDAQGHYVEYGHVVVTSNTQGFQENYNWFMNVAAAKMSIGGYSQTSASVASAYSRVTVFW